MRGSFFLLGDPDGKGPPATTTLSGRFSPSRNVSFGFSARSCAAVIGAWHCDGNETVTGPPHGLSEGTAGCAWLAATALSSISTAAPMMLTTRTPTPPDMQTSPNPLTPNHHPP